MKAVFEISPIAYAKNSRTSPIDDNWSRLTTEITLAQDVPTESLRGIENFSHLEVVYLFHAIEPNRFEWISYPRGNTAYPLTGIFAQRKKERPNRIGLCIVELLKVEEKTLTVKYFDGIDGTPVIDIKPVFKEFQPNAEIKQPDWVSDLMKNYW